MVAFLFICCLAKISLRETVAWQRARRPLPFITYIWRKYDSPLHIQSLGIFDYSILEYFHGITITICFTCSEQWKRKVDKKILKFHTFCFFSKTFRCFTVKLLFCYMKIVICMTEWEGRTGKYLARGRDVREFWPRAKYFPSGPT